MCLQIVPPYFGVRVLQADSKKVHAQEQGSLEWTHTFKSFVVRNKIPIAQAPSPGDSVRKAEDLIRDRRSSSSERGPVVEEVISWGRVQVDVLPNGTPFVQFSGGISDSAETHEKHNTS